jgi:hypothetical protein
MAPSFRTEARCPRLREPQLKTDAVGFIHLPADHDYYLPEAKR